MCIYIPRTVDERDMSCTKDMMPIVEELCGVIINDKGPFAECIKRMVRIQLMQYQYS